MLSNEGLGECRVFDYLGHRQNRVWSGTPVAPKFRSIQRDCGVHSPLSGRLTSTSATSFGYRQATTKPSPGLNPMPGKASFHSYVCLQPGIAGGPTRSACLAGSAGQGVARVLSEKRSRWTWCQEVTDKPAGVQGGQPGIRDPPRSLRSRQRRNSPRQCNM